MNNQDLEKIIAQQIGPDFQKSVDSKPLIVHVYPANIIRVLSIIKDHPELKFRQLIDISGIDYPNNQLRFELAYHLLSLEKNLRVIIKIQITDKNTVPSAVDVFPNANWYEREIWDMFGVAFENHPDLRRILSDYSFDGYPLRKDFPLSGYTEVFFNQSNHKVEYKKLDMSQPFRDFNFLSPWEGNWEDLLAQEKEAHE